MDAFDNSTEMQQRLRAALDRAERAEDLAADLALKLRNAEMKLETRKAETN